VRRDRRRKKKGRRYSTRGYYSDTILVVTVAQGEELRGLGLALEASNQIDCQLILPSSGVYISNYKNI
jgi:hypothetical protein